MGDLDKLSWPVSRLGEALGRSHAQATWRRGQWRSPPPHNLARDGAEGLGRWIEATAGSLGLEPVDVSYAEVERLVRSAGPALLRLPHRRTFHLALLSAGGGRCPSLGLTTYYRLRPDVICKALCHELEQLHMAQVNHTWRG